MKKLENNWKYKTLENLEKDIWPEPTFDSHLVRRVSALRKIPLNGFSIEDMRIMIAQDCSLDYIVPLAIEALSADLLAEADFYEGDLLKAVLNIKPVFWKANPQHWAAINNLIKDRLDEIEEYEIDVSSFVNALV